MRSARRWRVTRLLIPMTGLVLLAGAAPALAQETETTTPRPDRVQITTPFAGVAVEPGSSATFSITVNGPIGDRVALSLEGLPEGWTGSLRGGGFEVSQVVVEEVPPVIDLEVEVPEDAEEGEYELVVAARADSGNAATAHRTAADGRRRRLGRTDHRLSGAARQRRHHLQLRPRTEQRHAARAAVPIAGGWPRGVVRRGTADDGYAGGNPGRPARRERRADGRGAPQPGGTG